MHPVCLVTKPTVAQQPVVTRQGGIPQQARTGGVVRGPEIVREKRWQFQRQVDSLRIPARLGGPPGDGLPEHRCDQRGFAFQCLFGARLGEQRFTSVARTALVHWKPPAYPCRLMQRWG